MEKQITLSSIDNTGKNVFIVFTSSIPNQHVKERPKYTRCETLFSVTLIGQEESGMTLIKNYMQCDPKIPMLARGLVSKYCAEVVTQLYDDMKEYLESGR